jgi:trimeric autotransporter adhesin
MRVDSGGGAPAAAAANNAANEHTADTAHSGQAPTATAARPPADAHAADARAADPVAHAPSQTLREMAKDPSPHKPDPGTVIPATATTHAAGSAITQAGTNKLIANKDLDIQWRGTRSAWNGSGGFSKPLKDDLRGGGIAVSDKVGPVAPGSKGPNSGLSSGVANNLNGRLAEQAIANEYRKQGYKATTQSPLPDYNRRVDVKVDMPHPTDARLDKELRIEVKATYTHRGSPNVPSEMASDLRQLADNKAVRQAGFALEKAGKLVRPIGLAIDAFQLGSAFHSDGNRIGDQTQHAAASLAGGAVGGVAGAIVGQALIPIPGVGAVVGAAVGSWLGSKVGESLLGGIKSLF